MKLMIFDGSLTEIDDEDFERVTEHRWHADGRYVLSLIKGKITPLGRFIMNTPRGMDCDHINHDRRDNRKANLRNCTHTQNVWNQLPHSVSESSKFKGVHRLKGTSKWQANIRENRKKKYLGLFDNELDAACAYNAEALRFFGEYACINEFEKVAA